MEKYNKYHESLNIDCGIKGGNNMSQINILGPVRYNSIGEYNV